MANYNVSVYNFNRQTRTPFTEVRSGIAGMLSINALHPLCLAIKLQTNCCIIYLYFVNILNHIAAFTFILSVDAGHIRQLGTFLSHFIYQVH